jgi:hypothetical protein
MLRAHLAAVEQQLLVTSRIPANSGHSLHKGTPREAFIKEFLEGHVSERLAVGNGEIISADSKPEEKRNQIDIVLHKRDYPRIKYGGGVCAFLVESVVATIEVKSTLTKEELSKSIDAARAVKQLRPRLVTCAKSGYNPPGVLSFVVAYDGPASMKTVHGWIPDLHREKGIAEPALPPHWGPRQATPSPSIDGVFVLGKGFLQFDNSPLDFFDIPFRQQRPWMRWHGADVETGALLMLFAWLTATTANSTEVWLDPRHYMRTFIIPAGEHWPLP